MENLAGKEVTITRTFNAPRELVFDVWTDPKHLKEWWGPDHFTNATCEVELHPKGKLYIEMCGPDGTVYPMKGTFLEIRKPEKLVFTAIAFEDAQGNTLLEVLTTVNFEDDNGNTKLTVNAKVTKATPEAAGPVSGMNEGWNQSIKRLANYINTVK